MERHNSGTSRRDFLRKTTSTLSLIGFALPLITATGCKDEVKEAPPAPAALSFDDLLAKLKKEPTLERFSATLAKEQNLRRTSGESGFTSAQISQIRPIFYARMCENLSARGISIKPAEINDNLALANKLTMPHGIMVIQGLWPQPNGTGFFDGSIARFVKKEPFTFGSIRLGKQEVSPGGHIEVLEITEHLTRPFLDVPIEGRFLDSKFVPSPVILYSESATRMNALRTKVSYEEERAVTLNNELGHFIFSELVPLGKMPETEPLNIRTPSGIAIKTSPLMMNELCSDYMSLTRVPEFKFDRYLKELWSDDFPNYKTCVDISFACCLRQIPGIFPSDTSYSPENAKQLLIELQKDPNALAAAKADFLEETDKLLSAFIGQARKRFGVPQ